MADPKSCPHEHFAANVDVHRIVDIAAFMAELRVECIDCHEPFRFLGAAAGLSYEQPRVSIDGLVMHLPMEPQGEPLLYATARFDLPKPLPGN